MRPMTNDECQAAWSAGFAEDPPILYRDVSHGMLSIARHSVGSMVNGARYTYTDADELIRDDVHKWLAKHRKQAAKPGAPPKPTGDQKGLFA